MSTLLITFKSNIIMKQVYILIFKSELQNIDSINSFFDRRELYTHEAINLNADLNECIWVLPPNH